VTAEHKVHGIDHHPHVGNALALDDVELLDGHDRVQAGELAPAFEAGLGPIAVGAADVDRPELAEHQQHFIEVLGARIVGVDQQRDILFRLANILAHAANPFLPPPHLPQCRAMTTVGRAVDP
jgi:hypothetical protein